MPKPYPKDKKPRMRLNAKRRYPVRGGGEEDTYGVLSTMDVFGLFPEGQIGRMGIKAFRETGAILWGHDGDRLPIGRANWIEYDGSRWTVGWQWAENQFAQEVRAEWDAGIITAMSVGMSVAFDDDFEVADVQLREASVVSVGADPGAYIAEWTGPADVVEKVRAELGRELTTAAVPHILKLAASLRPVTQPADEEVSMAENTEAEVAETEAEESVHAESEAAADESSKEAQPPMKDDEDDEDMDDEEKRMKGDEGGEPAEAASDPHRERVLAHARELVGPGFDVEGASTNTLMRASLAWEVGKEEAAAMKPVELAEAFAEMVERRSAALDKLLDAGTTSEKAAAVWKQANEARPVSGQAQGQDHPAHKKMVAELKSRHLGVDNRKEA